MILGPGQSIDILIPKGASNRIEALPSAGASLVDALAYALKTWTMVWGRYPGTKFDPGLTQKIAETLLDSDECLTSLRNLVLPGGTEVSDVKAVLGNVYGYSFTCLKPAWEKGYGVRGFALTFVTGAISWLADGIGLIIGDAAGIAASLRFVGNWKITFAPVPVATDDKATNATEAPVESDQSSFAGDWDAKFSHLKIDPAGTGTLTFTVPCCISATFPIGYETAADSVTVTVTGPPTIQGDFNDDLPEGTEIAFRWAEGFEGQILTGRFPDGTTDAFLCGPQTEDDRCYS